MCVHVYVAVCMCVCVHVCAHMCAFACNVPFSNYSCISEPAHMGIDDMILSIEDNLELGKANTMRHVGQGTIYWKISS